MSAVEYRGWIQVPDLPFEKVEEHERLHRTLLVDHVQLGPVMTWDGNAAVVVLGTEAEDEAAAARILTGAVSEALHASDLGHLHPAGVTIERADVRVAA